MTDKAKVYSIFLPCYSSRKHGLLRELQGELDDVDFVGLDELSDIMGTEGRTTAYQNIRRVKDKM